MTALAGRLSRLRIQVVAEDTVGYDTPYLGQHGISLLLTADAGGDRRRVLVDVAQDPAALLENMRRMDIDPRQLDAVVLTHCHYDHTRGIARILAAAGKTQLPVVAHTELFRPHFVREPLLRSIGMAAQDSPGRIEAAGGRLCLTRAPFPLMPGLATTGEVPRTNAFESLQMPLLTIRNGRLTADNMADDLSVVADIAGCGLVIITGCSHAGIVNICRHAMGVTGGRPICGILGGLHLLDADDDRIAKTAAELDALDPQWIYAGHCTGFRAQTVLHQTFQSRFAPLTTGMCVEVGGQGQDRGSEPSGIPQRG